MFSWAQRITLYLDSDSPQTCLEILHCTPQLQELRLSFSSSSKSLPHLSNVLVLPRLRALSLNWAIGSKILEYLGAPVLQSFRTDMRQADQWSGLSNFAELVARSNCVLRELTLETCIMSNERPGIYNQWIKSAALQSLRVFNLHRLNSRDSSHFSKFLNLLTNNDPPLLPHLDSLRIRDCEFRVRLPPLVHMLTARRAGTLQSFYLSFKEDVDDWSFQYFTPGLLEEPHLADALVELKRLRAGGLRVDPFKR
ncbi:hypothetical protein FB45DRAFT_864214 [Roridomyces roridus]|uniref:Uncharacterized protein n=1 Tax=Roridomyces roridus TaxID=1738132 RepID=A0AAD7FS62_9AGAR|nr:hypothetical protein FB45DRAFT_864214 [Roridomyces roridus]